MIYGILASLGFAGGVLLDKFELSRRHIKIQTFIPALFLALALLSAILMLLLRVPLAPREWMEPTYLVAFPVMLALAIGWNIFYFRALVKETVQELDLILLLEPLTTIVLASFFFNTERNAQVLLAALVAALALIIAHLHRHKVRFDQYAKGLFLAVLLMSLEVLVLKILLQVYHPVTLYFWRTLGVFVVTTGMFKPVWSKLHIIDVASIGLTALFGVLQMVSRYYGYNSAGVVLTTLLLLLGPILVEVISVFILHERLQIKTAAAFMVILVCVAYVDLILPAG